MRAKRAIGVALLAVLAGLIAAGEAPARAALSEWQVLDHVRAASAFEFGWIRDAPDFSKLVAVFGMTRKEGEFRGDENAGLVSGVSADPATENAIRTGGPEAGAPESLARQLRGIPAKHWASEDMPDAPSYRNDCREGCRMLVYSSASASGVLPMIFPVAHPVTIR